MFDNLTNQSWKLIRKQGHDSKHQMQRYLRMPFDHDIAGAEIFFQPSLLQNEVLKQNQGVLQFNILKYLNFMTFFGIVLCPAKHNQGERHEAQRQDIMVDGASPKKFVPSHLNQCLPTVLTEQEERLVSILEIAHIERYVPKYMTNFCYPGRKPLDRRALARAFVAKAYCRLPTPSDLRRALLSAVNLKRICGFVTVADIPARDLLKAHQARPHEIA